MNLCDHQTVECLNPYELVRKYRCSACNDVMMCSCDREHGQRFLPHQLAQGCVLETQERVPVTAGFQELICPECRGERPIHAPKASTPGATSKVARYYWREIQLATTKRFYDQHPELDPNNWEDSEFSYPEERNRIEKEVIEEIKETHQESPKYIYSEKSQSEVLAETGTETILVKGEYVPIQSGKAVLRGAEGLVSVEEFAVEYFAKKGYSVLVTESVPFHVLFGVYMWPLIQDPSDPHVRVARFGSRTDFDAPNQEPRMIDAALPTDFGTAGYYSRRENDLVRHVSELGDLTELFEDWITESEELREYLWAHRPHDIAVARAVAQHLSDEDLRKILLYLSRNYWANFCGWPDLLASKNSEFVFVEVKSSNDKLSEEQKNWLLGNAEHMDFQVKIFKVGR